MCPVVTCHVIQAHVSKQKFNILQTKLGSKTSPVNDMTHLQSQPLDDRALLLDCYAYGV